MVPGQKLNGSFTPGTRCRVASWSAAITQAASLQVIAALPDTHHSLYPIQPILEYDQFLHPLRQRLIETAWSFTDGFFDSPDGPGLGITPGAST